MKIIFGINVPYRSTKIDWEATDKKRKETIERGRDILYFDYVRIPCIRIHQALYFELCDICGNQIPDGRKRRGITTCSPKCNKKKNELWAIKTEEEERKLIGERPTFFWQTIRNECFERDNFTCKGTLPDGNICGKIARSYEFEGKRYICTGEGFEAHHIIPISRGGTNEVSNLITLCYDCHKREHSKAESVRKQHVDLGSFG